MSGMRMQDAKTGLQVAKCWSLDRMVLLFEEMKGRNAEYASWEY